MGDEPIAKMTGDAEQDGKTEMAQIDGNKDGTATLDEIKEFMRKTYYDDDHMNKMHTSLGDKASEGEKKDYLEKMVTKDATELLQFMDGDKSGDLKLEEVIHSFKDDELDDGQLDDDDDITDRGDIKREDVNNI